MRRTLLPQTRFGHVAAACGMRTERPNRRLTATDELRRLTQLMLQQAEQLDRVPKRNNLFTGSISQLTHRVLNPCRFGTQHAMLNNHGLDSLELGDTSDDVLSCMEDRCDSDLQCGSNAAVMLTNSASLTQKRHMQSPSYNQYQHRQQQGQQNLLIIPKRLHLDRRTEPPYESCSPSSTSDRGICQDGQTPNVLSSSLDSHASTIDEGNRCDDSYLFESASSDNSQELIFQPTTPRRSQPVPQPSLADPEQSIDETMEIWESDRNRSPSPNHQPADREWMAVHPNGSHSEGESGRHRKRTTGMEPFQTNVGDVATTSAQFSPALLKRQLRLIDQCSSRQSERFLKSLCTCSSNCCGGRRNKANSDASVDSSINLVNGACVLCRPGSLPGINIEGLTANNMPCSHGCKVREEKQLALPPKRSVCLTRKSSSNKRVSFSACAQRDENSEVQTKEVTTDTESLRASTKAVTLEVSIGAHNSSQQIDFDSRENLAFKRASRRCVKLDSHLSVDEAAAEIGRRQTPLQPQPQLQPPPVPPHATNRLGHRDMRNRSATDNTLTGTYSMENDTSIKFEAGQPLSVSHSQPNDYLSSTDNASNINIAIGHFFTTSELNSKWQRSEFGFKRTADVTAKLKDNQDTLSMLSDQEFASDKVSPASTANALEPRATTLLQAQQSQRNAGLSRPRDSNNQSSSEKGTQIGGSNCANSTVNRHLIHRHHHHLPSARMQPSTSQSAGCSSTTTALSVSPNRGDYAYAHLADSSSYVVFQHPPEMSRSANAHGSALEDSEDQCGSGEGLSDDSIAFSWVTSIEGISRGQNRPHSKENGAKGCNSHSSSRRNSHADMPGRENPTGKVLFSQVNTVEGQLVSIKATVTDSAKIGDTGRDLCVRSSEVRDAAAVSSVAKRVIRPPSAETIRTSDSSESDSSQPFLILEAISCGHKDNETHVSSMNCRRFSPALAAAPTAAGQGGAIAGNFGAEKRQRTIIEKPPQAKPQSQPLLPLLPPLPPSLPPPPTFAAPPPPPPTSAALPQPPAAVTEGTAAAAATADVVRDLLMRVCDPAEAATLTRALVRGLVCNVESLRSALVAALMLLKDRKSCTGPLAQAIGTANTLDDLIRQVQASHRRLRLRRRQKSNRHHRHRTIGEDEWWQAADISSASTTLESEGDSATTQEDEMVVEAPDRTANDAATSSSHRHRRGKRDDAKSWGSVASRRSERSDPASLSTLPCQAMAHYVIGEQFLEPSLEQRFSLECRPVTTRLVRPESRAVNLSGDSKQKRPVTRTRCAEPRPQQTPVRNN